jgi:hypothetical protein
MFILTEHDNKLLENEFDTMSKDFDETSVSAFERSLFYLNKHTLSKGYVCIPLFIKEDKFTKFTSFFF